MIPTKTNGAPLSITPGIDWKTKSGSGQVNLEKR